MTVISVEQGSQEWHDLRSKYIRTASRTPAVVGVSPFSTKEKLADEIKFGIKPYYSQAMRDGNDLEDHARDLANASLNDMFIAQVGLNDDYLASLDGINFDGDTIIEIKVSEHTYKELLSGNIPEHYLYQIQHQLMVFNEVKVAYLVAYSKEVEEVMVSEPIYPDKKIWAKIRKAWDKFDKFLAEYEGLTTAEVDDVEALRLADEYVRVLAEEKAIKDKIATLKQELLPYANDDKTIIGSISISKTKGRTTYDYAKFIKDKKLEITDEYKKVSADSFTFRVAS